MDPFTSALPIWHPAGQDKNQVLEFKSSFAVVNEPDCVLYLNTTVSWALWINGAFALAGSPSCFEDEPHYDEIPLEHYVTRGSNVFQLFAFYEGIDTFTARAGTAQVTFSLFEGEDELLVSDMGLPVRQMTDWRKDVPKITPQLGYSFDYTAGLSKEPFMPSTVCGPARKMVKNPCPLPKIDAPCPSRLVASGMVREDEQEPSPARRMQNAFRRFSRPLPPPSFPNEEGVTASSNGFLFDLSREMCGYLMLDVSLPCEGDILIGWGEHLDDTHVRTLVGGRCFAAHLHLPEGRSTFLYPFKRMGLRYLEIHVSTPSVTFYYAGIRPSRPVMDHALSFRCADHLHTKIYQTCLRTLLLCRHEHYEDCPWREQALYAWDGRLQMLCGYYAFEESSFAKSSLDLLAHSLRKDGLLELIAPGKADITIPVYSLQFVTAVSEYTRYSEDFIGVRPLADVCRRIIETFDAHRDSTGLLPRFTGKPYWNFYEWQTGLDGHPDEENDSAVYDAPLNACFMMALRSMASLESALGVPSRAALWLEKEAALSAKYHQTFYNEALGAYASFACEGRKFHYCELTQALTLCAQAVPSFCRDTVLHTLAYGLKKPSKSLSGETNPEEKEEPFYPVTLNDTFYKYEALLSQPETYASYVFEKIAKEYGAMLKNGATSFYETLEGSDAFEGAGSLCHGWSAIPAYFYLKYIVDIKHEGSLLTEEQTGLFHPQVKHLTDPSRKILYEW